MLCLNVKKGRSQDSQAGMSDSVERVEHEVEGILEVKSEKRRVKRLWLW